MGPLRTNFIEIRIWIQNTSFMTQSLDTDVQRPFYSVATVVLLPYWEENDGGHVE